MMASPSLLVSEHETVLTVQDEPLHEIINGQRVDLPPMSAYATGIASRLHLRLGLYAEDKELGVSVAEMLFVLDAEHNLRRRPDVAFVSTARWPLDRALLETGDWDVVPDLASQPPFPRPSPQGTPAALPSPIPRRLSSTNQR